MLAGMLIGASLTALFIGAGARLLEEALIVGVVSGLAAFVAFLLLRLLVVSSTARFWQRSSESARVVRGASLAWRPVSSLLARAGLRDPRERAELRHAFVALANAGATAVGAWIGTAATLALVVTMAGTVVSLATVVVAHRQIDRLDRQNELIDLQLYEAKATRVSAVFAAQLPSLLVAIEESRPPSSSEIWEVPPALIARIQGVVNLAEPYSTDSVVSGWKTALGDSIESESEAGENRIGNYLITSPRKTFAEDNLYSPERGQLLLLLLAARFPFGSLPAPLDFSHADLRGQRLATADFGPTVLTDLGETVLRRANLRDADLTDTDLSRVVLEGAILPVPELLSEAQFLRGLNAHVGDRRAIEWLGGADLSHAIVDIANPRSRVLVVDGGVEPFGKAGQSSTPLHLLWGFEDHETFFVIRPNENFESGVRAVQELLGEIGGVVLPPELCYSTFLPSLDRVREKVGDGRGNLAAYLLSVLNEHDPSVGRCVTGF